MLRVKFEKGVVPEAVETRYFQAEFGLEYRHVPSAILPGTDFLVIAGTLVMVFTGEDKELVAFDAYTNRDQWLRSGQVAWPRQCDSGRICLVDPELSDDRMSLDADPVYTYSDEDCVLQASLIETPEELVYDQVSDRLSVGVRRGVLARFVMRGLQLT